jgi:hypothetical protein
MKTHNRKGRLNFRTRIRKRLIRVSRRALYRNLLEMEAQVETARRERDALEHLYKQLRADHKRREA